MGIFLKYHLKSQNTKNKIDIYHLNSEEKIFNTSRVPFSKIDELKKIYVISSYQNIKIHNNILYQQMKQLKFTNFTLEKFYKNNNFISSNKNTEKKEE